MEKLIRFSDFIRIFQVDDKHHFFLRGFQAKNNGIWLKLVSESFFNEGHGLYELNYPLQYNIERPVHTFPCTLKQLIDFFCHYNVSDIEERFDLSEFKTDPIPKFPQIKTMEKFFPALSIEPLMQYARMWAQTFYNDVPIKRIYLYKYSSKWAEARAEKNKISKNLSNRQLPKYAIIFEIDADNIAPQKNIEEKRDYHKQKVRGLAPEMLWDRLLRDIHYSETVSEKKFPLLLQPDFYSVYKSLPEMVPFWEWNFYIKFNNSELQDDGRVENFESYIVLYENKSITIAETIAFYDEGFLPDTKLIHESRKEEWQRKKAEWAINNGSIRATYLVCLMASDKSYITELSNYWIKFQMNIAGDGCPDPSSFDSRINIWAALFQRWTNGDVLGVNLSNLPPECFDDLEPIQSLEYETANFPNVDSKNIPFPVIKLNILSNFLMKWKIPIPSVFSPVDNKNEIVSAVWSDGSLTEQRDIRQIRRINARQAAKTIWENEKITAPEMYKRPEIKKAYNGDLPTLKTFRRHMQGLNPNPNPGRRLTIKST